MQQDLAFILMLLSLSCFIIFAAIALYRHIRDEDMIRQSKDWHTSGKPSESNSEAFLKYQRRLSS